MRETARLRTLLRHDPDFDTICYVSRRISQLEQPIPIFTQLRRVRKAVAAAYNRDDAFFRLMLKR